MLSRKRVHNLLESFASRTGILSEKLPRNLTIVLNTIKFKFNDLCPKTEFPKP